MSTLARVLEPEVMDTAEEAADYDAMDNREPNTRFCDDCLRFARFSFATPARPWRALDVGAGTALIPIAMCERDPNLTFVAVDLAEHMLALATRNVERAGFAARIELARVDAKRLPFSDGAFDAVVSNSIVHHVPEPLHALSEMNRLAARVLFVRDLLRPESDDDVARLVALHGGAPDTDSATDIARHARQVALLDASLRAALTIDEVRTLVTELDIPASAVTQTSDRHFTLAYARGTRDAPRVAR